MPAALRLSNALEHVVEDMVTLTRSLEVIYGDHSNRHFVVVAPNHNWGARTPQQQNKHMEIVRQYHQVTELIAVLIKGAPANLTRLFEHSNKSFAPWLQLSSNWALSSKSDENEQKIRESVAGLHEVLAVLAAGPRTQLILVPDTNSLLGNADPTAYRVLSGHTIFDFLLLPTVLGELDELKMLHRNPDVRDKAKKIITRIKGWRNQGPLLRGVTLDETITVRALHNEPVVAESLSWLDADNSDDRIIASVLHVQAFSPSAHVILITGDINLQNKADAAMIEVIDADFDADRTGV